MCDQNVKTKKDVKKIMILNNIFNAPYYNDFEFIQKIKSFNSAELRYYKNKSQIDMFIYDLNSNGYKDIVKDYIYQLIKPKGVLGKKKVRVGSIKDGGYVLLDDFENIKFAYSFGIGGEISFDTDLANRNIDIYMYDYTINKLPFENLKFHWKKIGLTSKKGEYNNMKTLSEILEENGHMNEKNMILKIDIEGEEWNIFNDTSEGILNNFKYIVGEFHFKDKYIPIYSTVFKKLNKTHQIFHLHCNNFLPIINFDGNNICSLLEVSFIIKENNKFSKTIDYFPVKDIDYPNHKNLIDFDQILNFYQIENLIQN